MDSRERVLIALQHKQPDRVPLDGVFRDAVWRRVKARFATDDLDRIYDLLGLDIWHTMVEPSGTFKQQAVSIDSDVGPVGEGRENWTIPFGNDCFQNELGIVRHLDRATRNLGFVSHPLSGISSVAEIEAYPFIDPEDSSRYATVQEDVRRFGQNRIILCELANLFKSCWEVRGMQQFMVDLLLEPALVEALVEKVWPVRAEQCRRLALLGVDVIMLSGDIAMQNGMLIAPNLWRRYFKPYYRRIISYTKQAKPVYFMFHSDGNCSSIIEDLIEVGFDVINPIQPESMDPKQIKQRFGQEITLHGTISVQHTLPFGTPSDVRSEVIQRIRDCGSGGGFILAPSNVVLEDTPLENLLALYETAQVNFGSECVAKMMSYQ